MYTPGSPPAPLLGSATLWFIYFFGTCNVHAYLAWQCRVLITLFAIAGGGGKRGFGHTDAENVSVSINITDTSPGTRDLPDNMVAHLLLYTHTTLAGEGPPAEVRGSKRCFPGKRVVDSALGTSMAWLFHAGKACRHFLPSMVVRDYGHA